MTHPRLLTTSLRANTAITTKNIYLNLSCLTTEDRTDHLKGACNKDVFKPYGSTSHHRNKNHKDCQVIEEHCLQALTKILNKYHHEAYSDRFWRILLGHWNQRACRFLYYRIEAIRSFVHENNQFHIELYNEFLQHHVPRDSLDFVKNSVNPAFLLSVDSLIIPSIASSAHIALILAQGEKTKKTLPFESSSTKLELAKRFLSALTKACVSTKAPLISNLYLGKRARAALFFFLKDFPQIDYKYEVLEIITEVEPDMVTRCRLSTQLPALLGSDKDTTMQIIAKILPYLIPTIYLEGFNNLHTLACKVDKGRSPKYILTANAFDTDELFKLRTALFAEKGVKYFVLQHGNNYGTDEYSLPIVEETTSDYFLTWGWDKPEATKYIPVAMHKYSFTKFPTPLRKGNILIVTTHLPYPHQPWDVSHEYSKMINNQKILIETLNPNIRSHCCVRLHSASQFFEFGEKKTMIELTSEDQVEESTQVAFPNRLLTSRLVVFTSDSTGMLECLRFNFPCIALIPNTEYLTVEAASHYERLARAQIIFTDPIEMAVHVNSNWDSIGQWWDSHAVQEARLDFIGNYARISSNPPRLIAQAILKSLGERLEYQ